MDITKSVNGVPIRLTDERWIYIIESHDDLAGYFDEVLNAIEGPDYVIKGYNDALIALRSAGRGRFLAVVYKEIAARDGFVITAYFTSKIRIDKEEVLWQKPQLK